MKLLGACSLRARYEGALKLAVMHTGIFMYYTALLDGTSYVPAWSSLV